MSLNEAGVQVKKRSGRRKQSRDGTCGEVADDIEQ